MSDVTKPMALDETLQDVADALDNLTEGYAGESAYEAAVSGGYTLPQSQFEADTQAVRWRSNPNLLDNWYFVGGGDQQGGGQFPVNQRKQTQYTAVGRSVDRWLIFDSNVIASLESGGLKVTLSNAVSVSTRLINYVFENSIPYRNCRFTLSFLVDNIDGNFGFGVRFYDSRVYLYTASELSPSGLYSLTFDTTSNMGDFRIVMITPSSLEAGKSFTVKAVKLELGSEQTLAHLENGAWVLNELPDYTTQLLRCQRFYRVFTSTSTSTTGYGYSTNAKNLRPEMRATPTTGLFTYGGTTYYYLDANL